MQVHVMQHKACELLKICLQQSAKTGEKKYLFLYPIDTGFQASNRKEKSHLPEVSYFPFPESQSSLNFLYLKMVKEIT